MDPSALDARPFLAGLFAAAVAAADPAAAVARFLPPRPKGRTVVVGAGKASASMAKALAAHWDGPISGAVVVPHGQAISCEPIEVMEAAHPVPDEAGLSASRRLLEIVRGVSAEDLVIALISGGGSALLPAPPAGMTLADEIAINEALLHSGAPIAAMNVVRKHVSAIKGGRLAHASAAPVVTLVVSDIPGDDPALVASGPTVPDASTREDALRIVREYRLALPPAALRRLASAAADAPPPSDRRFSANKVAVIASAGRSLEAAAAAAHAAGVGAAILSDAIEGEARDVGFVHAAIAREVALRDRPFRKPVVLLSGGETTVTVRGGGRGGRNGEFLLAFAIAIAGMERIDALAADTDGRDGSEDNAGAFADGSTATAIREAGRHPLALLRGNDSHTGFAAIGALFTTGATGTNVNDFRAILVR
jgi:hydroxypyruvate reductase